MLKLRQVLTREEIARIKVELSRAQFYDGTETGYEGHKKNLQIDFHRAPQLTGATQLVLDALMRNRDFTKFVWPRKVNAVFNRYDPGMTYKAHADAALMGRDQTQAVRADVSFTLFLVDPDAYDGGALALDTPYGPMKVKEPAGDAVVYSTLLVHGVEPVTRGSRVSAVGWIQSFIKDPNHRQIAYDLDKIHRELLDAVPESDLPARLDQNIQNLIRSWVEN